MTLAQRQAAMRERCAINDSVTKKPPTDRSRDASTVKSDGQPTKKQYKNSFAIERYVRYLASDIRRSLSRNPRSQYSLDVEQKWTGTRRKVIAAAYQDFDEEQSRLAVSEQAVRDAREDVRDEARAEVAARIARDNFPAPPRS